MASEALKMIVEMMRAQNRVGVPDVQEIRAGLEAMTQMMVIPDDVVRSPVKIGSVPAEWLSTPGCDAGRVILYLHGGGYACGSINTHRDLGQRLSRAAQARVLMLDYRLAPEHPHPAAVDDATAAYEFLLSQHVDPRRIVVAGDSAGGGLTVATLLALRDQGRPLPAAGFCISPWVDLTQSGESMTSKAAADPMVQRDGLTQMAVWYLNGQEARRPLASPLFADLSRLPPLLIHVGTAETLLDDSTRLAKAAKDAGVDVTLDVWEEMIHVWHAFASMLPEGQAAIDRAGEFIRQRTPAA